MSSTYALLGLLQREPSYGYDLKRVYDRYFGREKPLAFGQVYATLSRLQSHDKIASTSTEQESGPERRRFAITEIGRADLEQWLERPEDLRPRSQAVLLTKVITSILVDRSPNDYLDLQRSEILQQMRKLTKARREGDLAQMLTADNALFHLEADLRWIDLTADRLGVLIEEITNER